MTDKAKWTFMVYMAGDNNLSSAGDVDLTEMRSIGSNADINILVEFDNEGQHGTHRYHIQKNGAGERVESLGETDSGAPNVLLDFVSWAADNYPAERYALILWNHGGGWEPSEIDRIARSAGAPDYNEREAAERSATPLARSLFRSTLQTIFSLPSASERAICSDDGSGHSLDTVELGRVLSQIVDRLGQPLDLLGMDACLMSNFEVAYQARPYARYMVASEESEPNNGWPYDRILGELTANPEVPTPELAVRIVEHYLRSYLDRGYAKPVTQSAFDLSKAEAFAGQLGALATAITADLPAGVMSLWTAQRNSARFWHNTLWDIKHFCEELEKTTASEAVRAASQAVRESLAPGPENFIVAEGHSGEKVARCGWLTVYLISPLVSISQFYAELDFSQDVPWLQMLKAYHST